jgi:hypothetical protein
MRDLIEKAPIAAVLADVAATESAAAGLRDERTAAVVGEIRRRLEQAIADAERPPADGMSAKEEALREGVTVEAIWKRRQRARNRAA